MASIRLFEFLPNRQPFVLHGARHEPKHARGGDQHYDGEQQRRTSQERVSWLVANRDERIFAMVTPSHLRPDLLPISFSVGRVCPSAPFWVHESDGALDRRAYLEVHGDVQVILTCTGCMNRAFRYGVPALAGEAFDPSDAWELRKPRRLKAGLQTRRFMESGRHDFMPTWSGTYFIR